MDAYCSFGLFFESMFCHYHPAVAVVCCLCACSFVHVFMCLCVVGTVCCAVVLLRRVVPCCVRCEILGLVEKMNYRESICQ